MERQPKLGPAEGIGENYVRPGFDVSAMNVLHAARLIEIPALWGFPGGQTPGKQLGAHGPVDHQETSFGNQIIEN